MLHSKLLRQLSQKLTSKFSPSQRDQNLIIILPSKHKIQPKHSYAYSEQSTSLYLTVFTSKRFTLRRPQLYQKDEQALPGNLQSNEPPLHFSSRMSEQKWLSQQMHLCLYGTF